MKKRLFPIFALLVAGSATACGNDTTYHSVDNPSSTLKSLTPSGLVVLPRHIPDGYSLEFASVDTGPGSSPVSGDKAKKGKRFQGSIAKNASGSTTGGTLHWCSASPADFKSMCSDTNGTVFYDGMVGAVHVNVFGDAVDNPPRKPADLTQDISQSPWAK